MKNPADQICTDCSKPLSASGENENSSKLYCINIKCISYYSKPRYRCPECGSMDKINVDEKGLAHYEFTC